MLVNFVRVRWPSSKAAFQFHVTGLNDFMRDRRIADLAAKCSKSGGLETVADVYTAFDFLHRRSNRQVSAPAICYGCMPSCCWNSDEVAG